MCTLGVNEGTYSIQVGSTKSLSGHSLGAAGVHEAIYSLLMLDRGYPARVAKSQLPLMTLGVDFRRLLSSDAGPRVPRTPSLLPREHRG